MDIVDQIDPYCVAKLDDKLQFVCVPLNCPLALSLIRGPSCRTLFTYVNERWKVKSVPGTATASVDVLGKDEGNIIDDHVGKFVTIVTPGAKECSVEAFGPVRRSEGGTFWLKVSPNPPNILPFQHLAITDRSEAIHGP